jgi:hypothetical protein
MAKVELRGCLKRLPNFAYAQRGLSNWRVPNNYYATDVSDTAWALIVPLLPAAQPGGRPRTTNIRAVINAIFYLLRTGCGRRIAGILRAQMPRSSVRMWNCRNYGITSKAPAFPFCSKPRRRHDPICKPLNLVL